MVVTVGLSALLLIIIGRAVTDRASTRALVVTGAVLTGNLLATSAVAVGPAPSWVAVASSGLYLGAIVVAITARSRTTVPRPTIVAAATLLFFLWTICVRVSLGSGPIALTELAGSAVNELCAPVVAFAIARSLYFRSVHHVVAVVAGTVLAASLGLALLNSGAVRPTADDARFSGVLTHPNSLATVAVVALIAAAQLRSRSALVWLVPPAVTCLLLSDSRAGLLSAIAVVVVWQLTGRGRRAVTAVLVLVFPLAVTGLASAFSELLARRSQSVESREFIWTYLYHASDTYLPWGIGSMGIFDWAQQGRFPEPYFHAHDQFLTWIVAGGVLGVLLSVVWLCAGTVASLKTRESAVAFVGMLPLFLVESPLQTGTASTLQIPALLTWLLLWSALMPARVRGDLHQASHGSQTLATATGQSTATGQH